MIRAKITSNGTTAYIRIGKKEVYDYLTAYGVDDFEAIETDSWSEIASIGEIYHIDDFEITIVDTFINS